MTGARKPHASGRGALLLLGLVPLCAVGPVTGARAHQLSTAVLSLREVAPDRFVTSWERVPGLGAPELAYHVLKPVFPDHCRFTAPDLDCRDGGLAGPVGLAGLGGRFATGVINIAWREAGPESHTLTPSRPRVAVGSGASWHLTAAGFLWLGTTHILGGWDHLLFVLGLVWLVRDPKTLLKTVTGFTVAHSITLTAATLGWTRIPVPPVEAVIALSIAFVAVEARREQRREARGGPAGLTTRFPWLVAFSFGLLHGFGFASALGALSIAPRVVPLALFSFNVGVELGQLAFVATVWPARAVVRRRWPVLADRGAPLLHYGAGTLAMFWFFERIHAFW